MVDYMDERVGRVVAKIDDLWLGRNTLVPFYSDNGTHLARTGVYLTSAAPLA